MIMLDDREEKLSKMRGRNLKRPMAAGNCIPKDSKNDFMAEKWNLMNPQGKEWSLLYLQKKTIKIAFAGKGFHFDDPLQFWFTHLFLCFKQ